jgi:hypothetical protein
MIGDSKTAVLGAYIPLYPDCISIIRGKRSKDRDDLRKDTLANLIVDILRRLEDDSFPSSRNVDLAAVHCKSTGDS